MDDELNITSLYEKHLELNAEMDNLDGWQMPVCYQEISAEAQYVREHAGVADCGNCTIIRFSGKGADKALDGRLGLPVIPQQTGECRRNLLLNISGGVIEVVYVCRMAEEDFLLISGDGNARAVENAITAASTKFIKIEDLSDYLTRIDFIGGEAADLLKKSGISVPDAGKCAAVPFGNDKRAILCRMDIYGIDGVMLIVNDDLAVDFWSELTAISGAIPCGHGTLEQLRIENFVPFFPSEFNEETMLNDSGISGIFQPLTRKFFGRPALERHRQESRLVQLKISSEDTELAEGEITSITPCPGTDGMYLAIASLPLKCSTPESSGGTAEIIKTAF